MAGTLPAGSPDVPSGARELACEPDAVHWAEVCGWVPGTGHCDDRGCADGCVFRAQRAAEAATIIRRRRLRRIQHHR